ncbi:unnamed protein product [Schistosoma margrebowiei]|uniref:Uncharacterized protein n=1 Tax=Schistosoma margrebowiei TaxID=48269 RepID=A0A3P7YIL5_9TREM|nr:unnamed protein product [Schistosoma margrebowiei]
MLVAKIKSKLKKHRTTWWTTSQISIRPFFEILTNSTNSRQSSAIGFRHFMIYSMERGLLWRATGKGSKRQPLQHAMRFWATRSTITMVGPLLTHWIRFEKEGTRRQQSIPAEQE